MCWPEDRDLQTSCKWMIGIVALIIVVLAIALPVASLESLEPTEVGLIYNTASIDVDSSTLKSAGRHFIGVACNFIRFPYNIFILCVMYLKDSIKIFTIIRYGMPFKRWFNSSHRYVFPI